MARGELVELVNSFECTELDNIGNVVRSSLDFLKKSSSKDQDHSRLCCAVIKRVEGGNAELSKLLHFAGDTQVLVVVSSSISNAK